ncbi:MAG: RNase adapter RapZ [Betaproteobacteria bacterium]
MQLVLISGLSGSGKSIALNVLEDAGFYVVDNLPAKLLVDLVDQLAQAGYQRAAISVDVRSGLGLIEVPRIREALRNRDFDVKILFLDAKTETLVKRFSETRRRHPLSDGGLTLTESIERERELLSPVSSIGHRIDTSDLSANTLRAWVKEFVDVRATAGLTVLFESFGFKHGIPLDADFVFDVRCLPNPHYDEQLRPLTGRDEPVVRFLEGESSVGQMLGDIRRFLARWLPAFARDNRSYVTIGIGCTGGRHRSVYLVNTLANEFASEYRVLQRHRELGTES